MTLDSLTDTQASPIAPSVPSIPPGMPFPFFPVPPGKKQPKPKPVPPKPQIINVPVDLPLRDLLARHTSRVVPIDQP